MQLIHFLKQSIKEKTSDEKEKKCGLFLSGGTDSRTVLAAFERAPVCFTLAVSRNNEYRVAREIAAIKKAKHIFIRIDPDPYTKYLDALVQLGGGMYAFDHALFFGFKDIIAPMADVVFHGHGIDYMFQGMYVPSIPVRIGSVTTYFLKLRTLSKDFITDFLSMIPYRLKGVNLLDFVKQSRRNSLYESLREAVREILTLGEKFCNTSYDFWEYTLMHALSRHYPYTNLSSMATCAEQRTVTFHNDIFNLYLSLPVEYRLGAKMARKTLKNLSPPMAGVRTGNTNLRADYSPLQKQWVWFWDELFYRSGLRKQYQLDTPAEERTWPDRDRVIRRQPALRQAALNLCQSEALASLNFLDMDKLSKEIKRWLEKPEGGGAFMIFLITQDRFLRQ